MLDKKDVLQKYRAEGKDEGFDEKVRRADEKGFVALAFCSLLLMIYKVFMDLNIGDILALLNIFIVVVLFNHYKEEKSGLTLFLLIFHSLFFVASLVWFVSSTL
ncbi:DUF6442 family protein [Companilactobacillus zhongbaensis]|uniref:DUF6442 family protein n=1 Tax=Companilactobacillus zhongbaensis TaxID=2486009 RepID=UPI001CDBF187|nr:DUF6442 family protein [Companilactobacillus zhongbaensis]